MLGEYECAYTDEHKYGRYDNALTALIDCTYTRLVLTQQALGDKDGIVVTLTEYECGQDNAHNVELDAQHIHYAQYPYPAHCQRQERNQGQFQIPERYPKEGKDNESAQEKHHVEVIRE